MTRQDTPRVAAGRGLAAHPLALPAIALAAALWATAAIVASDLFRAGVTPLELTAARAAIAAAGFGMLPAAWAGPRPPHPSGRLLVIGLGLALALVTACYYGAIARLPVAIAIVLQYAAPALVVAITALVERRRPSALVTASLIAALAGVALVTGALGSDLGGLDPLGVALALASAALFAGYTMAGERARRYYRAPALMLRGFTVAAIFWIVVLATRGWPQDLFATGHLPEVLFVGIGGTLLPFLAFVWAVAHLRAERAAIGATLEPVLAALGAWIWLGQRLTAAQLVGGALVIVAVLGLSLRGETAAQEPPPG